MMADTVFVRGSVHGTIFGTAAFRSVRRFVIRTIRAGTMMAAAMSVRHYRDCKAACQHHCRGQHRHRLFPVF